MEKQERKERWAILMILLGQLIFIFCSNLFKLENVLDHDCAKLIYHALCMKEDKKIFLESWSYMTTLELDCSTLFALPILGLTQNVYLAYSVANTIIALIYIGVIYAILRRSGVDKNMALVGGVLVLIPYSFGMLEYYNMMFFGGGQYTIKVLTVLCTLLVFIMDGNAKYRDLGFNILTIFLIFVCAVSSGVYIMMVAVIPVGIAYVLLFLWENGLDVKKILRERNMLKLVVFCVTAMSGIGIHMMKGVGALGNSFKLAPYTQLGGNVIGLLNGFAGTIGALPPYEVEVLSVSGITYLFRFVLMVILLISLGAIIKKVATKDGWQEIARNKKAVVYILSIVFINALILVLTKYGAVARYMLVMVIPSFLLVVIYIDEAISKVEEYRTIARAVVGGLLICILLTSDYQILKDRLYPTAIRSMNQEAHMLKDGLQIYEDIEIYFVDSTSTPELLRVLDYGSTREYYSYMSETDTIELHGCYTNRCENMKESHLLVLHTDNAGGINEEQLLNYKLVNKIGGYQVWATK